ncbi:hypothetical protein [Polaribacter tangerinus]|uniref:hypothetical protein n=1 Tax=Polaribacter tangerinus TaxID=1920034 RepID=UPI001180A8FC|nr:hypothetical protein [Polaribacter tangerinus]
MKKVILGLLFVCTSLTMNAVTTAYVKDCADYAKAAANAEEAAFGAMNFNEWREAFDWYQDACESVNGNIETPQFVYLP